MVRGEDGQDAVLQATNADTNNAIASQPAVGESEGQPASSYEAFWAQFDTPIVSDSNLPSALQTPRVLGDHQGNAQTDPLWPILTQMAAPPPTANGEGNENAPPSDVPVSHPPVASRFRKRRRGTSPASGERVKKSARRKDKAKVPLPAARSNPALDMDNPWTVPEPESHHASRNQYPLSMFPSTVTQSINQTPYTDFTRPMSATTSFYERRNDSASYPTPHAVHDSPFEFKPLQPNNDRPPPPINLLSRTTTSSARRVAETSTRPSTETWAARTPALHETQDALAPERSQSRDDSMTFTPRLEEDETFEARHRLREVLSDPTPRNSRARTYQGPTVEDLPEDGELEYASPLRQESAIGWSQNRTRDDEDARRNGFTLPPLDHRRRLAPRTEISPSRGSRQSESEPRSQSRMSESRFSHDEAPRTPRQMSVDIPDDPQRSASSPPLHVPPPRHYRRDQHQDLQRDPASSPTPASRLRSLDIFDVGDDDNMPEAVRRGGAAAAAEDERPTPIPREGDPEIHLHDPEAHLRGMSDNWIQEVWSDPTGTSITLSTFNPHFTRSYGANRRTASDLRQAIARITGESGFLVIAPDQAADNYGRGPVEWAITGLSTEAVELVLRRRVWSFKAITFFPRRRALDNPRWVLALEGFLDDDVATIHRAVRSTFERPQVRQRIEQMIRANPEYADIPTNEAFRRIMATLRVTVYTLDNDTVVANVLLRSPTQSVRVWRRWIQELRELTFDSFHTAIARVRRVSACAGCSGVDHPSHLCPFPRMLAWNGPDAAGGQSYSIDGRERRAQRTAPPRPADQRPRSRHGYVSNNHTSSQAGPSNARLSTRDAECERSGPERDREYTRNQGRDRHNERRGGAPSRRMQRDDSRPPKGGRDGQRRERRH